MKLTIAVVAMALTLSCSGKSTDDAGDQTSVPVSLGVQRELWTLASPPIDGVQPGEILPTRGLYDPAFIWCNPYRQFEDTSVYAQAPTRRGSSQRIHVLVVEFRPQRSRTRQMGEPNATGWGGIIRALPDSMWDQSRTGYIEFRMAVVRHGASAGTLRLDLGRISEDVNNNGLFDTEDRARGPEQFRNGLLEDDEDVGLDGVPDSMEVDADGLPYDPVHNPDPVGDNWDFDNRQGSYNGYDHINGTEKSLRDPLLGLRPDGEDIGGGRFTDFDEANAYYEFSIDLDDPADPSLIADTEKRSGDVTEFAQTLTWNTYHLALWNAGRYAVLSDPGRATDSTNCRFARIWLAGADSTVRVYVAAMTVVDSTGQ